MASHYKFLWFFIDPFEDLVSSEWGEAEANSSSTLTDSEDQISESTTTKTTTTTTIPTTTIPKSCPAPDVTYNGSLLTTVEATFKVDQS